MLETRNVRFANSISAPNAGDTAGAVTLAVTTGGSDAPSVYRPARIVSGDYSAYPFLTLQAALDALPKILNHEVIIEIGVGTFAGAQVFGFNTAGYLATEGTAKLRIQGTMGLATVATGINTGTATSATANTVVDTTQSWTVDDLAGKWVEIISGTGAPTAPAGRKPGVYGVITSNTATVINIRGGLKEDSLHGPFGGPTAGAGSGYRIVEPATVIQRFTTGSVPCIQTKSGMGTTLRLSRLSIGDASMSRGLELDGLRYGEVCFCKFPVNTAGQQILWGACMGANAFHNSITGTGTPVYAISVDTHYFFTNYVSGGGSLQCYSIGYENALRVNTFKNMTGSILLAATGPQFWVFNEAINCPGPFIEFYYDCVFREWYVTAATATSGVGFRAARCPSLKRNDSGTFTGPSGDATIDNAPVSWADLTTFGTIVGQFGTVLEKA